MTTLRVLGMISGTSHDGIDVAIVDFELGGDDTLRAAIRYMDSPAYDEELRRRLQATLPPGRVGVADVCELDTLIGQAFADAAVAAVASTGPVDLVCSHGQTIYHWISDGRALGTLQVGQPAWIAEQVGAPVVSDVRAADIAAGGQGAPLVPVLDALLLAGLPGRPAALNLGGIANLTVPRPPGDPVAYDVGPANALIDAVALRADPAGPGYDVDGALAASGTVDPPLLADLLDEPYYARPAPKSTGKELFHGEYLAQVLVRHPHVGPADVAATVTALTARTVADQVRAHGVDTLIVSGGGWHNPQLRQALAGELPGVILRPSDDLGAPVDAKEAIAFALVGWCSWHGVPAAFPSCTGATNARVLGRFTPGGRPLRLPTPLNYLPTALVIEEA